MKTQRNQNNVLAEKWAGPRVVRSETERYDDPGIDFSADPGKTDQSQAEECDVNFIVKRFHRTGVLPGTDVTALYGDFSKPLDYQESLNTIIRAQEQFDALDPHVRKRFHNDPAELLEFMSDERNYDEAQKSDSLRGVTPDVVKIALEAKSAAAASSGT